MSKAYYQSPTGWLSITTDSGAITGIHFCERPEQPENGSDPVLRSVAIWLDRYFSDQQPSARELPLRARGTTFQELVWSLLLQIPYGQSRTYGELARQAAELLNVPKMSAQAIGGAVARNPIVIVIPCHRVLGAKDALTGFSAGLHRKICLLRHEQIPFDDTCISVNDLL